MSPVRRATKSHDSIVAGIVQVPRLRRAETERPSQPLQTLQIGGTKGTSVKSNVASLDYFEDVSLISVDAVVLLDELDVVVEALVDQDEWRRSPSV